MDDEQLEFDFNPEVCKCNEQTNFDDLCANCLNDCLEWMNAQEESYDEFA